MAVWKILEVSITDKKVIIVFSDFKNLDVNQVANLVVQLEELKRRLVKKWKLKNGDEDVD